MTLLRTALSLFILTFFVSVADAQVPTSPDSEIYNPVLILDANGNVVVHQPLYGPSLPRIDWMLDEIQIMKDLNARLERSLSIFKRALPTLVGKEREKVEGHIREGEEILERHKKQIGIYWQWIHMLGGVA